MDLTMHTQTDLIEALAANRDAEIAAIDAEIERQTEYQRLTLEQIDGHRATLLDETNFTLERLRYRRTLLITPKPELVEKPSVEETPEQKAARIVGLKEAA